MPRYTYAFGYVSHEQAKEALDDMFAAGEVSPAEFPLIETYSLDTFNDTMMKRRPKPLRYMITLGDD